MGSLWREFLGSYQQTKRSSANLFQLYEESNDFAYIEETIDKIKKSSEKTFATLYKIHICPTWKLNSIEVTSIQLFKWVQLKSFQFNFSTEFSIQWCFWFQSEFRKEKLNLISNWNWAAGDGGPESGGGKKYTQWCGCPPTLHHVLHSPPVVAPFWEYG